MSKNTYWIVDVQGVYAQVEGAEQRDLATRVHGWVEADEPGSTDQVHVAHEDPEIGPGRLPYGALQDEAWGARGWKPGPPPELPALAAMPLKTTKSPAAAGGEKNKE